MLKQKFLDSMDFFLLLEKDFDSYGGEPPTQIVVDKAKKFVIDYSMIPYFIGPGPNGNIVIEYRNRKKAAEVHFDNDGNMGMLLVIMANNHIEDDYIHDGDFSLEKLNEFLMD